MATERYYQLLQQLAQKQKRQGVWRSQITLALNELRVHIAKDLGVESLRYDNGTRQYVEVLTPSGRPFHVGADGVVSWLGNTPVALAKVVVALEYDGGMATCECPLWVRYQHARVEFCVAPRKKQWLTTLTGAAMHIHQVLMTSLMKDASPLPS
ncbi:hypothetical protein J7I01_004635 [Vibrio parahaemolyticus]|nr:hypothetical protein [Vibrio parahaemolyticus]